MATVLRISAVMWSACLSASVFADAPLIHCVGTESGGHGPRRYAYEVDAASYPMIEFQVGTNDPDLHQYSNVLTPPGWNFTVSRVAASHIRGVKTPHGEISPGPCRCLTTGTAHWWTDDPAWAVEHFVFGYDHSWVSEDVGWDLTTRREGSPPQLHLFSELWDANVGTGAGPLHGPSWPKEKCVSDSDCSCDSFCEALNGMCGGPGTCRLEPHGCLNNGDAVCGCDATTYSNACRAAAAGVSIAHTKACLRGDLDLDGDVSVGDFAVLVDCMSGPGGGLLPDCAVADLDVDRDVDLRDFRLLLTALASSAPPRIAEYANSGCLPGTSGSGMDADSLCGDDHIELTAGLGTLHVLHRNATYNCCVDDIAVFLSDDGAVLRLSEEEFLAGGGCDCLCCYNVEATVVGLAPGTYTVEFCWQDGETGGERCRREEITIPGPRVDRYSNSGCLPGVGHGWLGHYYPCDEDEVLLTAEPGTLHVLHKNATYNCCVDDIVISLSGDAVVLMLSEQEILTTPCFCMCCYDVKASIVDLAGGAYLVEFCWDDYETGRTKCSIDDIVVP